MKRIQPKPEPLTLKARVRHTATPWRGVIIKLGEQVSEVRWDHGPVQFITNSFLRVEGGEDDPTT